MLTKPLAFFTGTAAWLSQQTGRELQARTLHAVPEPGQTVSIVSPCFNSTMPQNQHRGAGNHGTVQTKAEFMSVRTDPRLTLRLFWLEGSETSRRV